MSLRQALLFLLVLMIEGNHIHAQRLQGQARLDSLLTEVPNMKEDSNGVMFIDAIAIIYCYTDPVEAMKWAQKELDLAKKINWRKGEAWGHNMIGTIMHTKGDLPSALEAFFKSLHIDEEIGDKLGIGNVSCSIGSAYFMLEKYEESLSWQLNALRFLEEAGSKRGMSLALSGIAMTYLKVGRFEEALPYQLKSVEFAEEVQNLVSLIQGWCNLGTIYMNTGSYNDALKYYFRCLRLAKERNSYNFISISSGNIGICYWMISKHIGQIKTDSLVSSDRDVNLKLAVPYLQKGIAAAREGGITQYILDFTSVLSKVYALQGKYKGALEAYTQYINVKDSVESESILEKIANLETKRALDLKDKDIQIAKLAVANRRTERIAYLSVITLLVIIAGIGGYFIIQRNRKRQRARLEQMRQRIARDLHDDIGSMLSSISLYSRAVEHQLQDNKIAAPLLTKIAENSGKVMEAMSDIVWSMNTNNEPESITSRMREYAIELFDGQPVELHFKITDGDNLPLLGMEQRRDLYLIYKEALNNIAKYASAKNIRIGLSYQSNTLTLTVHDDGKGFDTDKMKRHGNGLKNMASRAQSYGGTFDIASIENGGTSLTITLPVM